MLRLTSLLWAGILALGPPDSEPEPDLEPDLEAQVRELFDDECSFCHGADDDFPMERAPSAYVGVVSSVNGRPMVVPGAPEQSYLYIKLATSEGIDGDIMPPGSPVSDEALALVHEWIAELEPEPEPDDTQPDDTQPDDTQPDDTQPPGPKEPTTPVEPVARVLPPRDPFHGTHQIVLPTTATLGRNVLQYRIDHRFGRIGTARGAFGLDVGAIISFGLAFGILDGWDVLLRRTNSLKGWELGSKYVPLRQEDGRPLSLGVYASVEYLREFPARVANPWSGNFMAMISRLWFDRWSTMLTVGYHMRTNHAPRVVVDLGDGPVRIRDRRDTLTLGLASTVWVDRRRRWGIDIEYLLPIPDGGTPRNAFYYHGGDADPQGTKIGAWALGGSYRIGDHFFQVFLSNNREIHTGLSAPGGQTANPFPRGERPNFFLGFNLARKFHLGHQGKR